MPAETAPLVLYAGQIVLADTSAAIPCPKSRTSGAPAVVVEDDGLFAPSYPNSILVPLTEDAALAIPDLSIAIAPTTENGCSKPYWAVFHLVATTAKARLQATPSRITQQQLAIVLSRRVVALPCCRQDEGTAMRQRGNMAIWQSGVGWLLSGGTPNTGPRHRATSGCRSP